MKEFRFEPISLEGTATIVDTEEFEGIVAELKLLETQKLLLQMDNEKLVEIDNKAYFLLDELQKISLRLYRSSSEMKTLIDTFFVD